MPKIGDSKDVKPTVAQLERMVEKVNAKGRVQPRREFTYSPKAKEKLVSK